MKTGLIKKILAISLISMLRVSVLVNNSSSAEDKKIHKQEITYNLGAEPKSLDPALANDTTGNEVLVNTFTGLCELDDKDKAIKGVAESWDISDDKLTYTFHLRKDSKWSNGDTVKASDFEYAWKRVLDPKTASQFAYQLLCIKGAKDFNSGNGNSDNVGVKAIDDYTLVVNLENPTPYFLELTATPQYFPVDQKVVENNKDWANNPETFVSNGAFRVISYKMKDEIILEKNENYYDKDQVKLDKLNLKLVSEETSAWASYKSSQFDVVDTVPKSEIQGALKDGTATNYDNLATYYLDINVQDKNNSILKDSRIRKALSLAIDRQSLVKNVTKGGQTPAHSLVAKGIKESDGKDYTEKNNYIESTANIEEAKKLLAEAGYPDGQGLPTITLTYNPEGGQSVTMQALQDMWKKIGINVELQSQEWKVFLDTRTNKNFDIARDGWNADYVDPMTFLDVFTSNSEQNNCGYSNSKYDSLINSAKQELDTNKRMDLLHKAEDILMEDMPVIPLYYYTRVTGIKDYVKGTMVSSMSNIYFKNAYVEK